MSLKEEYQKRMYLFTICRVPAVTFGKTQDNTIKKYLLIAGKSSNLSFINH